MVYNDIIKNKHKTKQALIKAIKDVINDNDYQDKLNNLLKEKETLEQRLSKIIDMELDNDIDRKEMFIQKEHELLDKLNQVKQEINNYQQLLDENKGLSKQIKAIDAYFDNQPATLKKFNREAFDNMIQCIIVGDYDSEGNKLPRVARFVLKTGKEYKFEISKNSNKDNSNNDKNNECHYVLGTWPDLIAPNKPILVLSFVLSISFWLTLIIILDTILSLALVVSILSFTKARATL